MRLIVGDWDPFAMSKARIRAHGGGKGVERSARASDADVRTDSKSEGCMQEEEKPEKTYGKMTIRVGKVVLCPKGLGLKRPLNARLSHKKIID